jgi:hypothetical protein
MIEFVLFSPQAGWASTFCIAKKVDKNARTGKLLRQTVPVRAAATKLVVFCSMIYFGAFSLSKYRKSE